MLDVNKLKDLMKEKGIESYKELAICTKIPYTTLVYMANGHDMYVSTLIELSKFFNIPIDDLISKSFGTEVVSSDTHTFESTTNLLEALFYNIKIS